VPVQESTKDLARLCKEMQEYAENNRDAIINYHCRYHSKQPVSSSREEGCVDEIANARMAKKQRPSRCAGQSGGPGWASQSRGVVPMAA
jgi:hypothetical protein